MGEAGGIVTEDGTKGGGTGGAAMAEAAAAEPAVAAAEAALAELAAAAPAASPAAMPAVLPPPVPEFCRPAWFSQPAGADGSTIGARVVGGGVQPRGSSRRGSRRASRAVSRFGSGRHSVGRAKRPLRLGAIELMVFAVEGCTSPARRTRRSSSRCRALRGRSATERGSSSSRREPRPRRNPKEASSQSLVVCQSSPNSQGRPATSNTTITSGVPTWPNTCSKPVASNWPKRSVPASPGRAVASVQLATNTLAKPSHRRIEPPLAPPGSMPLTSRQTRGMNQTAEIPNQPKTTVCIPGNVGSRRRAPRAARRV
ncbi:hypothetical protein I5680_08775 [Burkholderia gladioli]|nr:hypothetical protein [Burkholderia gladioli]MBJ9674551.1 hypothetical protein [Burkholderia gladioli]